MTNPNVPQAAVAMEGQNPLAAAGEALHNFAGRIGAGLRSGYEAVREVPVTLRHIEMLGVSAVTALALANAEAAVADSDSVANENVPGLVGAAFLPGVPEATVSAGSLVKPTEVMAAITRGVGFIGRQTGFTQLRPKMTTMSSNKAFVNGGKESCRPGHDNDPLLYFLRTDHHKTTVGDCLPGFPIHSASHTPHPRNYFNGTMNNISSKVEASTGINISHGDTKQIKATKYDATFTYKCAAEPSNSMSTLAINGSGKKVAVEKC